MPDKRSVTCRHARMRRFKHLQGGRNPIDVKPPGSFAAPSFCPGKVAQLVEQRTENPCVPGSIPGLATTFRSFTIR
jgi:hypothetical protein